MYYFILPETVLALTFEVQLYVYCWHCNCASNFYFLFCSYFYCIYSIYFYFSLSVLRSFAATPQFPLWRSIKAYLILSLVPMVQACTTFIADNLDKKITISLKKKVVTPRYYTNRCYMKLWKKTEWSSVCQSLCDSEVTLISCSLSSSWVPSL